MHPRSPHGFQDHDANNNMQDCQVNNMDKLIHMFSLFVTHAKVNAFLKQTNKMKEKFNKKQY